jgi:hypothetical protein
MRSLLLLTIVVGCGDNHGTGFDYDNPSGGKLRLINSKTQPKVENQVALDFIVGDQPLTGYSVGFNLPVGHRLVRFVELVPGTALDPGSAPMAASGAVPLDGPLADTLVTGLAQKAAATDATLAPGTLLYSIKLQTVSGAPDGVVFDGTAASFILPSGGMRDRGGTTVVEPTDVAIGKLEIN